MGHFKDEFPTVLNFARNLGNSVYKSIKMITNWAAYYSPHPIPSPIIWSKKTRRLNSNEQETGGNHEGMSSLAWQKYRQRTVRQETTKFKAGTLPLNMYRSSPLDYPKEKIYLFQTNQQEKTILAQEVQGEEKEQQEEDKAVSTNPQEEVEDEYDRDSEIENPVEEDNDDDSLTFMRAVTTRSGRAVRVKFFRRFVNSS